MVDVINAYTSVAGGASIMLVGSPVTSTLGRAACILSVDATFCTDEVNLAVSMLPAALIEFNNPGIAPSAALSAPPDILPAL